MLFQINTIHLIFASSRRRRHPPGAPASSGSSRLRSPRSAGSRSNAGGFRRLTRFAFARGASRRGSANASGVSSRHREACGAKCGTRGALRSPCPKGRSTAFRGLAKQRQSAAGGRRLQTTKQSQAMRRGSAWLDQTLKPRVNPKDLGSTR